VLVFAKRECASECTASVLTYIFFSSSGKVSIVAMYSWIEPKTDSKEDEEAADKARQMHVSAS
jgi:hypothetical protein